VNDQVPVGESDRLHHLKEQLQFAPLRPAFGGSSESLPFNELHHQVGSAALRLTPVQEAGDIWMIEACQYPPFLPEAGTRFLAVDLPLHDFDGGALLETAIVANGFENSALPAFSELAHTR